MEINKSTIKKILLIITFAIVMYTIFSNLVGVIKLLGSALSLISPFILGLVFAFIINVPMVFVEKKIYSRIKFKNDKLKDKILRPISFLTALLFISGIIWIVLFTIMPQIKETITSVIDSIPAFSKRVQAIFNELINEYPQINDYISDISVDWKVVLEKIINFLTNGASDFLDSTFLMASSIFSGIINFFLGLIFAVYILLQKEKLSRHFKKLMYSMFKENKVDKTISILRLSNHTFTKFISGQCIEAVIIGALFFIAMSILKFPYALMISVLIAFTALIPVFGAFIGCGIGAFLILMLSPTQALWFIVMFIIIQQLEGNLIYPYVVGNSVGLPSIWVLVAVTLGAGTLGVVGMLLFIPLFSILYSIIKEVVNNKIEKKQIDRSKL